MFLNVSTSHNIERIELLLEDVNRKLTEAGNAESRAITIKNSKEVKIKINEVLKIIRDQKLNHGHSDTSDKDKDFAENLMKDIHSNIKYDISAYDLAYKYNFSEKSFARKIKRIFKTTPCQLIKSIKLNKAKELISSNNYDTVTEISYAVGYQDPHYFSKIFYNEYGMKPIQLIKNNLIQ